MVTSVTTKVCCGDAVDTGQGCTDSRAAACPLWAWCQSMVTLVTSLVAPLKSLLNCTKALCTANTGTGSCPGAAVVRHLLQALQLGQGWLWPGPFA